MLRENLSSTQAAPCSGVAGRSYLHADSCHGLQRRAGRRIQLQPHGSKHLETFLASASWGKIDCSVKAGAEWNVVPFPLLILPEANLSYITQRETFSLINNMEFLNDRYASMSLSYDMNGKLFNRIPLIKNLKWREMFRIRALWGH